MNILIANEQKLFRRGLASLINNMSDGKLSGSDAKSTFNIVGDVSSPCELINKLTNSPVDILLLGYSLKMNEDSHNPVSSLDGLNLVKWLKKRFPDLKIVVMSSYKHAPMIRTLLEMGISGYISMDISERTLKEVLISVKNNEIYVENVIMRSLFLHQQNNPCTLSLRESEILRLLCRGLSLTQIADKMNLSIKTISAHKIRAMNKLDVDTDSKLFIYLSKTKLFEMAL
ncbi:response regulator transcription factor [Enterobacter cloacae subsp. cloacae]|uniref:response regulator transcription factor n=1 Tax=Enterobacter cloacae TaxID=550 RepID=UPI001C5AD55A|nr:response regulator transcription factor [Enterobacter cloacae]MBW4201876.1 response regulator transcription factor [Enterobacter cloacae subsp. cloacae]